MLGLEGNKLSLYDYIHLCRAPCIWQIFFLLIGRLFVLFFPQMLSAGLPAFAIVEQVAIFALGHVLILAI